jgi:L-rhamnose mutarotase
MDLKKYSQELHKPFIKKFRRRKVVSDGIDDIHSCDLIDMGEWVNDNDGYRYMLNVVDVFSRFAWSIPLKTKTSKEVVKAFEKIDRKPNKIWVDEGKEFYNKDMDAYLKKHKITRYSTYGDHKSAIVERFNKTLKTNMWKRFTEKQTRRWIDMLDDLIKEYNNKYHTSIAMTPVKASMKKNEENLMKFQYGDEKMSNKSKYNIGDWVRISRIKGTFEKGYLPNWSAEIFKIVGINYTDPVTYELQDYSGEKVKGSFYEQEIQKTEQKDVYLIEKEIKRRKVKGKTEVLVKWLGWDDKYNSWIDESELIKFKK